MERPRQFMSDEVWRKILIDYIIPYRHVNEFCPPTFIPHKDSEPLLDKKLPEKLVELPGDTTIDIYSNGVLLPHWKQRGKDFMRFLGSLPNRVRYMMSYHPKNHDGSENDYSSVVLYLSNILLNERPPNVEFITVSHKSKWVSEQDQDNWKRVWEGLPITVHANCSINPWTGRMEEHATCAYNGCPYADFGHWFFGVTGNIIACCLDLEEEIVLGNVMKDDPAQMYAFTSAFYARQRKALTEKERPEHAVCDDCFGYKRRDREPQLLQLGVPL